jgi:hypothetical protein
MSKTKKPFRILYSGTALWLQRFESTEFFGVADGAKFPSVHKLFDLKEKIAV